MDHLPKMVDMALPPNETVDKNVIAPGPPTDAGDEPVGPRYPWGLSVTLNDESLAKLDLEAANFSLGEIWHLFAFAKVTSVSASSDDQGNICNRVELQITQIAGENEDEENQEEDDEEDNEPIEKDPIARTIGRLYKQKG
jgi:hypothetical protein